MAEEEQRHLPVLRPELYITKDVQKAITAEEKKRFLEEYYKTGNQSKAAKVAGRDIMGFRRTMEHDKAFAEDFIAVQNAMKHDLEQTMFQNGLKEKGYMDRITWLRKNFPKEYNPNYVDKDNNPAEAIKELSSKLDSYDLVPKAKVVEVKDENPQQD